MGPKKPATSIDNEKYEFTGLSDNHEGRDVWQIRNKRNGEVGGWIESEHNLDPQGSCWVGPYGIVCDHGRVRGGAKVGMESMDDFSFACVYGYASVFGEASVIGPGRVEGIAQVSDSAVVIGRVFGNAELYGEALLFEGASVHEGFYRSKVS